MADHGTASTREALTDASEVHSIPASMHIFGKNPTLYNACGKEGTLAGELPHQF